MLVIFEITMLCKMKIFPYSAKVSLKAMLYVKVEASLLCPWCLLQFQDAIVVAIVALVMATTQLQGSSLHDVGWR